MFLKINNQSDQFKGEYIREREIFSKKRKTSKLILIAIVSAAIGGFFYFLNSPNLSFLKQSAQSNHIATTKLEQELVAEAKQTQEKQTEINRIEANQTQTKQAEASPIQTENPAEKENNAATSIEDLAAENAESQSTPLASRDQPATATDQSQPNLTPENNSRAPAAIAAAETELIEKTETTNQALAATTASEQADERLASIADAELTANEEHQETQTPSNSREPEESTTDLSAVNHNSQALSQDAQPATDSNQNHTAQSQIGEVSDDVESAQIQLDNSQLDKSQSDNAEQTALLPAEENMSTASTDDSRQNQSSVEQSISGSDDELTYQGESTEDLPVQSKQQQRIELTAENNQIIATSAKPQTKLANQDRAPSLKKEHTESSKASAAVANKPIKTTTAKKPKPVNRVTAHKADNSQLNRRLLTAVETADTSLLKQLIADGADVNARNKWGWTALMNATIKGHQSTVELLLQNGANPRLTDTDGRSPLMAAILNNHPRLVSTLLRHSPEINKANRDGWSALSFAAWKGDASSTQQLLAASANKQHRTHEGFTPLQLAKQGGHQKVIELLSR